MLVYCEVPPGTALNEQSDVASLLVPYRVEIESFLCRGEEISFLTPFILRIGRFNGGAFVAMDPASRLEITLAAATAPEALIEAIDEFYERWTDGPEENPLHRLHQFTTRTKSPRKGRRPISHQITGYVK